MRIALGSSASTASTGLFFGPHLLHMLRNLLSGIGLLSATAFLPSAMVLGPFHEKEPDTFTGSFRMELHMFKKDKEEKHSPMNMRFWGTPDMLLFEAALPSQPQQMRMLIDLRGQWNYTLMDNGQGKRTAMKMRLPELGASGPDKKDEAPRITITNETRTIEGRSCTKVIAVSEDGTWTGWVAREIPNAFSAMSRGLAGPAVQHNHHAATAVEGFTLEYEWVPAKGDERIVCYIKDLVIGKVDDGLFDISGYQVMELPSFAMPQR